MKNPAWGEFTERAVQQGKIRFKGMSGHGGRLAECLDYAFDHDLVDAVLVAHNFGQDPAFHQRLTASLDFVAVQPELPRLLAKAKEKKVGVIAMKTLRGARLNDLRSYEREGNTFAQAAFRWVLSGPHVDALVVTMTSPELVDEYLGASGATRVSRADFELLARYEARNGADAVPLRLRRVPRGVSGGRADRRSAAHAHVRRGLRRRPVRRGRVRALGPQRAGVCIGAPIRRARARVRSGSTSPA